MSRTIRPMLLLCTMLCVLLLTPDVLKSQEPAGTEGSGIDRLAGTETKSGIQYARLVLKGSLHNPPPNTEPPVPPPLLIGQCSLRPNGKYFFELFGSFGGATDLAFYPPWTPQSKEDLFPPRTEKVTMTMEFLGYTKVKPMRRQWNVPLMTPGQYRYNSPGGDSTNMEEAGYYLRYLLSLPTLRLTLAGEKGGAATVSADFMTTPLLDAIRKEPLCRAAGI